MIDNFSNDIYSANIYFFDLFKEYVAIFTSE